MKKTLVIVALLLLVCLVVLLPDVMIGPGKVSRKHADTEKKCFSCHQPFSGVSSSKCRVCHNPAEIGKNPVTTIGEKKILFHHRLQTQNCMACHTDHTGRDSSITISNFNHSLIESSIVSKCQNCHTKPGDSLHQQFTAISCNSCHITNSWEKVNFDHSSLSKIPLAFCGNCHQPPNDDLHFQQPSSSCAGCHSTSKWSPSTFDHSEYFSFDKHHNSTCSNCHTKNNYLEYSCTNCHEHSLEELIPEHREEGIINITDCARCHKSGNENDILLPAENGSREKEKLKEYIKEYDD